jgi:hypothetical protein
MGCILCHHLELGQSPAQIHHLRTGSGMSQRASHFLAIPLCVGHHLGDDGLHGLGTRQFERRYRLSELDLLDLTLRRLLS